MSDGFRSTPAQRQHDQQRAQERLAAAHRQVRIAKDELTAATEEVNELRDPPPPPLTDTERRALPWYDPMALPYFEGDADHCRDPYCRDTNWGGHDRVHLRGSGCPPLKAKAATS